MADYTQKQKIEMKDIVLDAVKKVLEKSAVEFKGGYFQKKIIGNAIEEVYIADSRKEYLQTIETLSDLLLPSFDKDMKIIYKKINEDVSKLLEDFDNKKISSEEYVISKLKLMRKLFQKLMVFTERIKYFKKKVIIEDDFEEEFK